jgi:nucleotide-binding universal stress UspA family protein
MSATIAHDTRVAEAEKIFSRVLVGIDCSPASLDAARQAALLKAPSGALTYISAWSLDPSLVTSMTVLPPVTDAERAARRSAEDALRNAKEQLPSARTRVVQGLPAQVLLNEVVRDRSSLVAVGSRGLGRIQGIVLGSTASRLIHEAPCSVLLARRASTLPPRRIAVGVDGSDESAAAYAAARLLADRFHGDLTVVIAEGDALLDLEAVSLIVGDGFHVIPTDPVPALTAASLQADLLVVGSRGLHGLKSLGSVSERAAHRAQCSTLVVRSA